MGVTFFSNFDNFATVCMIRFLIFCVNDIINESIQTVQELKNCRKVTCWIFCAKLSKWNGFYLLPITIISKIFIIKVFIL